jgi:hypothetical protein
VIKSEILKVNPAVGMMSCVGIRASPPVAFGNYFSLRHEGLRVLNFWAENMKAAQQFLDDGLVQIRVYSWDDEDHVTKGKGRCCIIDDPRIPPNWYYNKLCYTGFGRPPQEVGRLIFEYLGDPTNEYECYTDPQMYYARRGKRYYSNGCVSWSQDDTAEKLIAEVEASRG